MIKGKGFTLIELMIVVAIIGILASIALPAYSQYMIKAKLTEAFLAAGACKPIVAERYMLNKPGGSWGTWGCYKVNPSPYVNLVWSNPNGSIHVRVNNISSEVNNRFLRISPYTSDGVRMTKAIHMGQNVESWKCEASFFLALPAQYFSSC